jgi:hypothetical protein
VSAKQQLSGAFRLSLCVLLHKGFQWS